MLPAPPPPGGRLGPQHEAPNRPVLANTLGVPPARLSAAALAATLALAAGTAGAIGAGAQVPPVPSTTTTIAPPPPGGGPAPTTTTTDLPTTGTTQPPRAEPTTTTSTTAASPPEPALPAPAAPPSSVPAPRGTVNPSEFAALLAQARARGRPRVVRSRDKVFEPTLGFAPRPTEADPEAREYGSDDHRSLAYAAAGLLAAVLTMLLSWIKKEVERAPTDASR